MVWCKHCPSATIVLCRYISMYVSIKWKLLIFNNFLCHRHFYALTLLNDYDDDANCAIKLKFAILLLLFHFKVEAHTTIQSLKFFAIAVEFALRCRSWIWSISLCDIIALTKKQKILNLLRTICTLLNEKVWQLRKNTRQTSIHFRFNF